MKHDDDNRSNQLNRNNPAYWDSRGRSNPNDPNSHCDDDGDDSQSPNASNPVYVDRRILGLPTHRTPVGCLSEEMQQRAEQFRAEFIKIANEVIKPEMDKYVERLKALRVRAEAEISAMVEYGQPQGWPFVRFTFCREEREPNRTNFHVEFFCIYSEFRAEVNFGTYSGIENTRTYTLGLDEITPIRVSKIINSTVRSASEHLYLLRFEDTEKGTRWIQEKITDLENFTPPPSK